MQHVLRRACLPLILAALAFLASLIMTNAFDDGYARAILSAAFAGWVAVSSGITGFLFAQVEDQA
jgi:hypothetical protein